MILIDLKVPSIGESITEVTLSKWLKPNGAFVNLDEPICEFESDKATLEFPSEAKGKLIHIAKEGDDLLIGDIIAQIEFSEVPENKQSEISKHLTDTKESKIKDDKMESVIELAMPEKQPDLELKTINESRQEGSTNFLRTVRREKLSRMRKTIAKRLVSAKNETAMLTTFNEVDMSAINELRVKYNEFYQNKYGVKIGYMSLFAKACSNVLLQMPEVNAHIDGEDLIYHDYVDISIAISTPNGLVVPPIHNVESLKFHEFESQLKLLAEKARSGKLSLQEMSGGTFTITNGGIFGSLLSTPIINEPQSAILGIHAIKDRPVAVDGQIVIRPMMYLALSYDHRVIDGSSSVSFLVKVKELLEDPIKLIFES